MASKADLVDQVKGLQRADPGAKQAWWDYCDRHLQGIKDPNRHEADTLQAFMSSYSRGGAPPRTAPRSAAPPPAYYGGPPAPTWGHPYAVAAYPPSAAVYGKGAEPAGLGSLAEAIKMGQRKSQHWKVCWQSYIALYGTGFNDPNKYDDGFLSGFLDYLGQLGSADLKAAADEQGIDLDAALANGGKGGAPPPVGMGAKRPLSAASGLPPAKRAAVGGHGGGSAEKDELVQKIKALQRNDSNAKEAWQRFCEERLQGVKDPNRHDEGVLAEFLAGYE